MDSGSSTVIIQCQYSADELENLIDIPQLAILCETFGPFKETIQTKYVDGVTFYILHYHYNESAVYAAENLNNFFMNKILLKAKRV